MFILFIISAEKWINKASWVTQSPPPPPRCRVINLCLSFVLRSRLLRLCPRRLLLLDPGGVHGGRAGQGFPQGRGGPGHHVGHRRLRLQRLRLSHGQSVSLTHSSHSWMLRSSTRAAAWLESCCCYATVENVLFKHGCVCCRNLNIFNLHCLFLGPQLIPSCQCCLQEEGGRRRHRTSRLMMRIRRLRVKHVIKSVKLQDRPLLLTLNSTQGDHTCSLGPCFGFYDFLEGQSPFIFLLLKFHPVV